MWPAARGCPTARLAMVLVMEASGHPVKDTMSPACLRTRPQRLGIGGLGCFELWSGIAAAQIATDCTQWGVRPCTAHHA